MQTPSNPTGSPLDLTGADGELDGAVSPAPGESLQRILKFELKEEGNHVLAVTVTYTETALGEGKASGGRVRTFRKLYQFVAQQLLSVRTKTGQLSQKDGLSRYLLEAQLENMGEAAVSLEVCQLSAPSLCLQTLNRTRRDEVEKPYSLPCDYLIEVSYAGLALRSCMQYFRALRMLLRWKHIWLFFRLCCMSKLHY